MPNSARANQNRIGRGALVIDSIVLRLHGSNGRSHVRQSAQEDFDDQPLQLAAENLTLRPLFRAFTTWYPNTGTDPPAREALHQAVPALPSCHLVPYQATFALRSTGRSGIIAASAGTCVAPDRD